MQKEKDEQTTPFVSGQRHEGSGQATVRFFLHLSFLALLEVSFRDRNAAPRFSGPSAVRSS